MNNLEILDIDDLQSICNAVLQQLKEGERKGSFIEGSLMVAVKDTEWNTNETGKAVLRLWIVGNIMKLFNYSCGEIM